jgi:hypothetical protein
LRPARGVAPQVPVPGGWHGWEFIEVSLNWIARSRAATKCVRP